MAKVTKEQLLKATKDACNKGFPCFKHGISSTPPHNLTKDYVAAEKVRRILPDCFCKVACDTSGNICGNYTFECEIPDKSVPSGVINAYIYVNRWETDIHFRSTAETTAFFNRFMKKEESDD